MRSCNSLQYRLFSNLSYIYTLYRYIIVYLFIYAVSKFVSVGKQRLDVPNQLPETGWWALAAAASPARPPYPRSGGGHPASVGQPASALALCSSQSFPCGKMECPLWTQVRQWPWGRPWWCRRRKNHILSGCRVASLQWQHWLENQMQWQSPHSYIRRGTWRMPPSSEPTLRLQGRTGQHRRCRC